MVKKELFIIYEENGEIGLEQKETKFGFLLRPAMISLLIKLIDQMAEKELQTSQLLKDSIESAYNSVSSGEMNEDDVDPLSMLTILKKATE